MVYLFNMFLMKHVLTNQETKGKVLDKHTSTHHQILRIFLNVYAPSTRCNRRP